MADENIQEAGTAEDDSIEPYYVKALIKIISTVKQIAAHLLTEQELDLIASIETLCISSKALLVRLLLRTPSKFHRLSTFILPPNSDRQNAADTLLASNLVYLKQPETLEEALSFLTKSEIAQFSTEFPSEGPISKTRSNLTKKQLTAALLADESTANRSLSFLKQSRLKVDCSSIKFTLSNFISDKSAKIKETVGYIICLHPKLLDFFNLLKFLYFLDFEADFSSAILVDLSRRKYPCYHYSISSARSNLLLLFPDRNYIELLLFAHQIRISTLDSMDLTLLDAVKSGFLDSLQAADMPKSSYLRRLTPAYFYFCTLRSISEAFEAKRLYSDAVKLLEFLLNQNSVGTGHFGSLYVRLSINYKKLGHENNAEAIASCKRGLADARVTAGRRLDLEVRLAKLSGQPKTFKFKQIEIEAEKLDFGLPGKKSRYRGRDGICSVEQAALEYYQKNYGWTGFHCEGRVFSTLFGLLFYDILFEMKVDGVFVSEYQTHPLDLMSESFYESRRDAIQSRLQSLKNLEFTLQLLSSSWSVHLDEYVIGVFWTEFQLPELIQVIRCIPGFLLAFIMGILAEDYKHSRAGMPDLLLYKCGIQSICDETPSNSSNSSNCMEKEYLLVEVKGSGDRLSSSQKFWHSALASISANLEICHVIPSKK